MNCRPRHTLFGLIWMLAGCTTLGPMPTVTGMPGAPEPRAGVELGAAEVPGFYLSSGAQEKPTGNAIGQVSALVDAGRFVDAPGLALGGRYVNGADDSGYVEPLLRYRLPLDDEEQLSLTSALFGSRAQGVARGASYTALRAGSELAANLRLTPESRYLELHFFAGASLLGLSASGSYCTDPSTGLGVDCPEPGDEGRAHEASGGFSGVYPAGFVGFGLDAARHLQSALHGVRLNLMLARGFMPTIRDARETGGVFYNHVGAGLAVRFGEVEAVDGKLGEP